MNEHEMIELDEWIVEHVMGWIGNGVGYSPHDYQTSITQDVIVWHGPFIPTRFPGAAMEVLKKCMGKTAIRLGTEDRGKLLCGDLHDITGEVVAETIELAICSFAKKLFSEQ